MLCFGLFNLNDIPGLMNVRRRFRHLVRQAENRRLRAAAAEEKEDSAFNQNTHERRSELDGRVDRARQGLFRGRHQVLLCVHQKVRETGGV